MLFIGERLSEHNFHGPYERLGDFYLMALIKALFLGIVYLRVLSSNIAYQRPEGINRMYAE